MIVTMPNDGGINIADEMVKNWVMEEVKQIGETVFFTVDGTRMSISKDDFNKL